MEELKCKAENYRMNSIIESTKRARTSQWKCYLETCNVYGLSPMPVSVEQACLYITVLAERLKVSSIITYYQAVVFHHVCVGLEPVRLSHPVLKATLKGIEKVKGVGSQGKDPMLPVHLRSLGKVVNFNSEVETLVFVAILLMFRSLLRVSHVVLSPHALRVKDVELNPEGLNLLINSSKTTSGKVEVCAEKIQP